MARDLRAAGARYVVVDDDTGNIEAAQDQVGVRAICAKASDDDALPQPRATRTSLQVM